VTSDGRDALGQAGTLFRHVTAERADLYRAIMDVFATAKRQFRLHLRPDEVRAEAAWPPGGAPAIELVQQALSQLVEWGNLLAQPDTTRVASVEDFYRARFVYRLSSGGEAVEAGLAAFVQAFARRAELQSVALEDILLRLSALLDLSRAEELDVVKVHEVLRDLSAVFASLADNAQAFMASVARSIDLSREGAAALMSYKARLMDYLERFIGDLVARSSAIAQHLLELAPRVDVLLTAVARREARDAAPDGELQTADAEAEKLEAWRERWQGLTRWFLSGGRERSQAELLRNRARSAIPQLLSAISALNERRSGKSDRSADFRVLARWFAECRSDEDAHRMYRAAFALSPARHLALVATDRDVQASTPWADAPAVTIHPKLRERGTLAPRGSPPQVKDRTRERTLLRQRLAEEEAAMERARARLARGEPVLLSELGTLDPHEFRLLLNLIGEALAAQTEPDGAVERHSGDGLLHVRLEPLSRTSLAEIRTELGIFAGRDHRLTVSHARQP
jgi:uncharacterized protein (TIGR02677 family)